MLARITILYYRVGKGKCQPPITVVLPNRLGTDPRFQNSR